MDGGPKLQGLLIDQVATADALLSAYALTGDEPYRMMAEEIGLFMLRTLAAPGGGFYDRTFDSADLGLLRSRRLPFAGNCEAARVFAQLARVSRESAFQGVARGALDCVAAEIGAHGPDGAYWLLAARDPSIR